MFNKSRSLILITNIIVIVLYWQGNIVDHVIATWNWVELSGKIIMCITVGWILLRFITFAVAWIHSNWIAPICSIIGITGFTICMIFPTARDLLFGGDMISVATLIMIVGDVLFTIISCFKLRG